MTDTPGTVKLPELLTEEQMGQMAELLKDVMQNGFGELVVVVTKGKVRFFKSQFTIPVCYEEKDV